MRMISDVADWLKRHPASDLAESWEGKRRETEEWSRTSLEEWVEKNPGLFSVVVATAAQSALEFTTTVGSGVVNVANLGKGAAEGGWGYAEDGLRLLELAGPLAKLKALASGRRLSAVVPNPDLDNCTWISAVKALRQTRTRDYATLDRLSAAVGRTPAQTGGEFVHGLLEPLRRLGARVRLLGSPSKLDEVVSATKSNPEGVVMFSVKWWDPEFASMANQAGDVGHTLLAYRHPLKGVVFADRSGRVVKNLRELEDLYPGIGFAEPYGTMAFVENAKLVQAAGQSGLASMLALEVVSVFTPPSDGPGSQRRPIAGAGARRFHVVQPGDSLSKIAQQVYGDMLKWPRIYEANKAIIGANPNLIHPGQRLVIP